MFPSFTSSKHDECHECAAGVGVAVAVVGASQESTIGMAGGLDLLAARERDED